MSGIHAGLSWEILLAPAAGRCLSRSRDNDLTNACARRPCIRPVVNHYEKYISRALSPHAMLVRHE